MYGISRAVRMALSLLIDHCLSTPWLTQSIRAPCARLAMPFTKARIAWTPLVKLFLVELSTSRFSRFDLSSRHIPIRMS